MRTPHPKKKKKFPQTSIPVPVPSRPVMSDPHRSQRSSKVLRFVHCRAQQPATHPNPTLFRASVQKTSPPPLPYPLSHTTHVSHLPPPPPLPQSQPHAASDRHLSEPAYINCFFSVQDENPSTLSKSGGLYTVRYARRAALYITLPYHPTPTSHFAVHRETKKTPGRLAAKMHACMQGVREDR